MKNLKQLLLIIFMLGLLASCAPSEPEGGGNLPEHGQELINSYITKDKRDESGGTLAYIKDVENSPPDENLWCVNARFVTSQGVFTIPILVSQRGEEWRLDRTPEKSLYEEYGCVWPK
ncbi:MAG: hypothetical protein GY796_35595 [Chloroflexi bacterium]|nr:hypothetical protein [Chloroflexota bacterium]